MILLASIRALCQSSHVEVGVGMMPGFKAVYQVWLDSRPENGPGSCICSYLLWIFKSLYPPFPTDSRDVELGYTYIQEDINCPLRMSFRCMWFTQTGSYHMLYWRGYMLEDT